MALLDNVAEAAQRYKRAEEERQLAREDLRAKVRAARDEGIPFAAIARAAGVSRERARPALRRPLRRGHSVVSNTR